MRNPKIRLLDVIECVFQIEHLLVRRALDDADRACTVDTGAAISHSRRVVGVVVGLPCLYTARSIADLTVSSSGWTYRFVIEISL